jgi:hypothetical protein
LWCKEAATHILTVHPEMRLAHEHVAVNPCVWGTKKYTRDIYTGYFMCLAPENEEGEEVEDLNEHAIEAISVTWERGGKHRAGCHQKPQEEEAPMQKHKPRI